MLKNIMTQFQNLKLTFQRLLCQVRTPISSMLVVCWLMLMILCLVFSVVMRWQLCCTKGCDGINAGRNQRNQFQN